MSQFGYEPLRTSKSRISLENPKERTWHPALILLVVVVVATAGAYFAIRLVHNAAVGPMNTASKDLRTNPDVP